MQIFKNDQSKSDWLGGINDKHLELGMIFHYNVHFKLTLIQFQNIVRIYNQGQNISKLPPEVKQWLVSHTKKTLYTACPKSYQTIWEL